MEIISHDQIILLRNLKGLSEGMKNLRIFGVTADNRTQNHLNTSRNLVCGISSSVQWQGERWRNVTDQHPASSLLAPWGLAYVHKVAKSC